MMPIKMLNLLLVALLASFFFACSDNDDNAVVNPGLQNKSQIRVIHASYDAPAVDIRIDESVAISSLEYIFASVYAEVDPGLRNIKVSPAGNASPVVLEADLTLEENKNYTVYAVNNLASIETVVSEDARTPNTGKAKVRLLHAAPDAPAVDLKLNSGGGPAVFSNIAFKDISAYIEVDEGTYTFVVTPAGATDEVVVFDPIAVQNGAMYTVIAHGTLNAADNVPFAVRVFVDNDPGNAFADLTTDARANAMVVHASPDAPGVDLLVDDTMVNTSPLQFPDNTGYLELNPGTRNIKVNAGGTSTSVIEADLVFAANKNYSIYAVDVLSNITPLVLEDDLTPPAAGKAHVRFLHLSPDAPAVDITLTDGTVVFGNYSFKETSPFTPLDAGTYDLQVRAAGTSTVVLQLPGITLAEGKIYSVFARGLLNGSGAEALGAEIIRKN